ncbi:siderophore-interacting protein [Comamonas aquatica]|uniref:siderophore-interacting protein n=1 Tax=Comamonas aquatica TaxID=225991 RepID=UPI00244A23AD|nr:siderophore-interacting protein [Comamonas aquatica]MDH1673176.1 siderophore-interacting protein [Comamonas aquatica]MDH1677760.1 siderophore-interacting protein [Comamonas aquatica]
MTTDVTAPAPAFERVRHPFKARHLQLLSREQISPGFLRLTLVGELRDFASAGFDDHFKLILPQSGLDKPLLPQLVDGKPMVDGPRPTMRDYTPLRWTTNTLTVDFALHDHGPATEWARTAAMGSWVGAAGPRGSLVIRKDFDWYWMLADASGLPAVERALAELPASAQVTVRLAVPEADRRALPSQAQVDLQWVDALTDAAEALALPEGSGFVWAAGEHSDMAALRKIVLAKGASPKRMRIAAYWKHGEAAHHAELADQD